MVKIKLGQKFEEKDLQGYPWIYEVVGIDTILARVSFKLISCSSPRGAHLIGSVYINYETLRQFKIRLQRPENKKYLKTWNLVRRRA